MSIFSNLGFLTFAIFVLGASIFVHELGHFLAARKRGLKVERFSIGFGPRLFGWKRDGVDYRISLLPLGGYVALPQLADMGRIEGAEDEGAEPLAPISYADKMIVAVMGAVFNVIFAFLLALVLWGVGREMPANSNTTVVGHVAEQIVNAEGETVPGPAFVAGIQAGDEITRIDGQSVRDWFGVTNSVLTGTRVDADGSRSSTVAVLRDGQPLTFTVEPVLVNYGTDSMRDLGLSQSSQIFVAELAPGLPAEAAGLQVNDKLISVDGAPVVSFPFFVNYLATRANQPIEVTVLRGEELITKTVAPVLVEGRPNPIIGFTVGYVTERIHQNPVAMISGMVTTFRQTITALVSSSSDVGLNNMSGPAGIVHAIHVSASIGLTQALWLVIFININLAIINLLPIPVLDGGHMVFATIAKIRGKALPRRFLEATQGTFVLLLFGMIIYISIFDVRRIFAFYDRPDTSAPAQIAPADPDGEADAE